MEVKLGTWPKQNILSISRFRRLVLHVNFCFLKCKTSSGVITPEVIQLQSLLWGGKAIAPRNHQLFTLFPLIKGNPCAMWTLIACSEKEIKVAQMWKEGDKRSPEPISWFIQCLLLSLKYGRRGGGNKQGFKFYMICPEMHLRPEIYILNFSPKSI